MNKICPGKCEKVKPWSEYHMRNGKPHGRCKMCVAEARAHPIRPKQMFTEPKMKLDYTWRADFMLLDCLDKFIRLQRKGVKCGKIVQEIKNLLDSRILEDCA